MDKINELLESKIDEQEYQNSEPLFCYSNEGFKNASLLNYNFDKCSYFNEEDLSLFEKREKCKQLVKKREVDLSISLDYILSLDNTNQDAQKEYLSIAVGLLMKKKNEDDDDEKRKIILYEKIQKAGIILNEYDYNSEVSKLEEEHQKALKYIDYKKILINSLRLIKEKDFDDNSKEIINSFKINKKFEFNQETVIGENNYYFYGLTFQLMSDNLFYISRKKHLYEDYLEQSINFISNHNFTKLTQVDIDYFQYLMNIILNCKFIRNKKQKNDRG